jgi:hypothetical protein
MGVDETCRRRAESCLLAHQSRSGGVPTYRDAAPIRRYMGVGRWMPFAGWCRPHTEVTAAAGRALAGSAAATAAWEHVRSQQRPDGSWSSYWWICPHYATLQAVELAMTLGDRAAVGRAAEWARRARYHDAFATALTLSVLLAAGERGDPVERAVARLADLQEDDGGWPSHPILRIPVPHDRNPARRRRRLVGLGSGFLVRDQHRVFTTATCVAALSRARPAA